MEQQSWESRVEGVGCPLCAPRAEVNEQWDFVGKLSASSLYLAKNQTYRGQCVLVLDPRHASRPDQISLNEWHLFCVDLFKAQGAVMRVVKADHLNIESLGNVVPHLHWHIIPRYLDDPRWGAPVWTSVLSDMIDTRLGDEDRRGLLTELQDALR